MLDPVADLKLNSLGELLIGVLAICVHPQTLLMAFGCGVHVCQYAGLKS